MAHTRYNYRITLSGELHGLNFTVMASPSPRSRSLLDIPQENLPIASDASKACIVRGNSHVKHGIAMGFVPLDRGGCLYRCRRVFSIAGDGAREVNGAIGGAC
jgi:hypothetical protein